MSNTEPNTQARFEVDGIVLFPWPPMGAFFGRDPAGRLHTATMNADGTPDAASLRAVVDTATPATKDAALFQVQAYLDAVCTSPESTYPANARTNIQIFDRPSGNVVGLLSTHGQLTKAGDKAPRDIRLGHCTLLTDAPPVIDISLPKTLHPAELIKACVQLEAFAQLVLKHHAARAAGYSEIVHHK